MAGGRYCSCRSYAASFVVPSPLPFCASILLSEKLTQMGSYWALVLFGLKMEKQKQSLEKVLLVPETHEDEVVEMKAPVEAL